MDWGISTHYLVLILVLIWKAFPIQLAAERHCWVALSASGDGYSHASALTGKRCIQALLAWMTREYRSLDRQIEVDVQFIIDVAGFEG
jgi:hypothetical protein